MNINKTLRARRMTRSPQAKAHALRCKVGGLGALSVGLGMMLPALLAGCGGSSGGPTFSNPTLAYDFHAGRQGWTADYSDAPANVPASAFRLDYAHANLPSPLDTSKRALRLTSQNTPDDLWYFLKRQVTGLAANTRYRVRFDVQIASDAPESSFGAGGSPGLSVVVKAGASSQEPQVRIQNGRHVFSLNKGDQSNAGTDALLLGNVAIPGDQYVYKLKPLDNANRLFTVTTDSSGRVWVFVGTESGFEGLQTLYYTRIKLTFSAS